MGSVVIGQGRCFKYGRVRANKSAKRLIVPISGSPIETISVFFQYRFPSLNPLTISQGINSGLSREEKGS